VPLPLDINRFFARYLCGGGALNEYRQVSRMQLALANANVGYFEPNAVNLSFQIQHFLNAEQNFVDKGITEESLCSVNQLLRKTNASSCFRTCDIKIGKRKPTGIPPKGHRVKKLMAEWFESLNKLNGTTETVFQCYIAFLYIHPFIDGNGRTARALLNYLYNQYSIEKMAPDIYRLKNVKESSFGQQINDFKNSAEFLINKKLNNETFFNDYLKWEDEFREGIEKKIHAVESTLKNKMAMLESNINSSQFLELLWRFPVITHEKLCQLLEVSKKEAKEIIDAYINLSVLEVKKLKSLPNQVFLIAPPITNLLNELDEQLFKS